MFIISDRVKELSTTSGSGSVALSGTYGAFQTFLQGIGDGSTTYYTIENHVRWEVGQGVYNASANSLSRDIVFDSSEGGAKINLEGISNVFCTLPADKAFLKDPDGKIESVDLTSGVFFPDGTFQNSALVVGSSGQNEAAYLNSVFASGLAVANSGNILAVSGIAVYASGHDLQTVTDNGAATDNEITINANFSAVSGSLSGIDFTPISEDDYPPHKEGRIFFDAENHTLTMYGEEPEISLQIGQEEHLRIRNTNSYTIANGSGVYLTGSQGTHPTVDYAIASGENTSHVVGLATHDIEPNSFGYITTYGIVRHVDTSAFSDGDELYLSAEHSGVLVNIPPIAPNYRSAVGHVIRSHHRNGSILVANEGVKLGGGDAKTLGNIGTSGIAFFESVTSDGNAGVLASDADFYYDSGNDRIHIGAGGIRFNDGTTQTTAAGAGARAYNNVTSDFSMTDDSDVVFLDTSAGPINVYLPTAVGNGGKELLFKMKNGFNSGVLVGSGSQTIDGNSVFGMYHAYGSYSLISDNNNWFII